MLSKAAHAGRSWMRRREHTLPGGFGTLDELFEALTLVQTGKITAFPVILMGTRFWSPLVDWLRATVAASAKIASTDLELFHVTDSPDEVVEILQRAHAAANGSGE